MNKKGIIIAEALISFFILMVAIETCFSLILWAKKTKIKLIKETEARYKTKAKMEELLYEDYELINNENGVDILEIEPGLKLIKVAYASNFSLVCLKNNDKQQ